MEISGINETVTVAGGSGVNTPGGNRNSTINGLPQSAINITIDGISAQDNQLKTGDGFVARVSPRALTGEVWSLRFGGAASPPGFS
jgi:hypothetical protein